MTASEKMTADIIREEDFMLHSKLRAILRDGKCGSIKAFLLSHSVVSCQSSVVSLQSSAKAALTTEDRQLKTKVRFQQKALPRLP
jgi:hypothetical protein